MKHSILVTGGAGQVGIELTRLEWPEAIQIHAPSREQLDLAKPDTVAAWFAQRPVDCVINLAAYTSVDRAEEEVATAFLVNAQGAAVLAEEARRARSPIIHVSTDYVFDGAGGPPYREDDPTRPLSVYGASKLAGELAVRAANPRALILRTAWVVSPHRSNFVKTILRLGETTPSLRIVADQHGCPTSARDIAYALQKTALKAIEDLDTCWGTYHFVNSGEASWYELAQHVFVRAAKLGRPCPPLTPISSSEYPTAARRPANSRLDTSKLAESFGISPRPWQLAVDEVVTELVA